MTSINREVLLVLIPLIGINTETFLGYSNCSILVLKKLPRERLMDLQTRYSNEMLEKESKDFFCFPQAERDEVVAVESRK